MQVSDPRLQVIPSFIYRAGLRVAELSRILTALQLTEAYDNPYAAQVLHEAQYLQHGLRSLRPTTTLTLDEQRYVCERLLPMIPESSSSGPFVEPVPTLPPPPQRPPSLTLAGLPVKVRGQVATPLSISGTIGGSLPNGSRLIVLRDGQPIRDVPALAGAFSFFDNAPGIEYVARITGTVLQRTVTRKLVSPLLAGVGAHGLPASQLRLLPSSYPVGVNGVARLSFTGVRQRIYLLVPVENGPVVGITQPDDNDADIAMAFTTTNLTLDFGADGSGNYLVLENFADFLGPFTLDLHVTQS